MRETKFRGKSKLSIKELDERGIEHTDGWIIGNLIANGTNPVIVGNLIGIDDEYIAHEYWCSVHPESVGQYTGFKDKNNTEIYEKHIVHEHATFRCPIDLKTKRTTRQNRLITFFGGGFNFEHSIGVNMSLVNFNEIEIIGNVYENPELLEGESHA